MPHLLEVGCALSKPNINKFEIVSHFHFYVIKMADFIKCSPVYLKQIEMMMICIVSLFFLKTFVSLKVTLFLKLTKTNSYESSQAMFVCIFTLRFLLCCKVCSKVQIFIVKPILISQ